MKIDANVTIDEHFALIRAQGDSYLTRALKHNASPVLRQRLLIASLRYFESRMRTRVSSSYASQSSQAVVLSQAVIATRPDSAFQSLLAGALDQDIATDVLIEACAKAADCQLLSVLVKCLFILANVGSIAADKEHTVADALQSPSQYEDDELFGPPDSVGENVNPQNGRLQGKTSLPAAGKISAKHGVKRSAPSNEVSVGRTGQSFVDEFISRLVEAESGGGQAGGNDVFVSSVAKEAPLSESAAKNVMRLLTRRMQRVGIFELPAFIYQLLLFASARGDSGAKSQVLLGITNVFAKLEKMANRVEQMSQQMLEEDEDAILSSTMTVRELRQVQGTALLHIEYAAKQDPDLSAQIVKLAKGGVENPKHFLTSFGMGIMLSLARSTSTQADMMSILRDALLRFRKEMSRRAMNLYVARVCMNDDHVLDPCKSLLYVSECTLEIGWDQVKESIVNFALLLVDKPLSDLTSSSSESDVLGEKLLVKLFKAHPAIRGSILEQLTTRIALHEKSSWRAISVIAKLSSEGPFDILEHSRLVRDGIEFLLTLPPWMASALVDAYKPLLHARQDLRDYFQLVIRKSLFHRDSSSRAVAINGFLANMSLCFTRIKSQAQKSSSGSIPAGSLDEQTGILADSLQPLRRAFSYAAPLRALLYKNAIQHMRADSPQKGVVIASVISSILRDHLQTFVSPTEQPYVHIEHCVDESKGGLLMEPLGDLIWCIAVAELHRDSTAYAKSYVMDLARKVASVSLQDFPISKELMTLSTNNEHHSSVSNNLELEQATARTNRNRARVLGSVCEALMHAVMIVPSNDQDWALFVEVLIPLLTLKGKTFDILRDSGGSSISDAFNELGGDLSIERLRPGMRIFLQRHSKASGTKPVKATGTRKAKVNDGGNISAAVPIQTSDHRFGMFSVLSSGSAKPSIPFDVVMRLLQEATDAINQRNTSAPNTFRGHTESRDFQELRLYLLATAQKHVDDIVNTLANEHRSLLLSVNVWNTPALGTIEGLAKLAMGDFKRFRRSPSSSRQGGAGSLCMAEKCAHAAELMKGFSSFSVSSFCRALMLDPSRMEHDSDHDVFESAVDAVEQLIDSLLEDELAKEAVIALRLHGYLTRAIVANLFGVEKVCSFLDKRITWVTDALYLKQIGDSVIVKTLVRTCLTYTENNNDLRRAGSLCRRLLEVIGDCDENAVVAADVSEDDKLSSAQSVQQETSLAIVDAILDLVDRAITDVDWCLSRMASLEAAVDTASVEIDSNTCKEKSADPEEGFSEEAVVKQAIRAEDAAHVRLEGIVRTMRGLTRCAIAKWTQQERLLRAVTKTYKLVSSATQAQGKRKGDPRTTFLSLINECKGLAPTLWTYLAFASAEPGASSAAKGSSSAGREARVMPQLVYEVERFEKVLIGAQKRTRINLLRGMRRNIARDFRIREDKLCEEEKSGDDGGDEDVPLAQGNAPNESRKKRRT